MNAARATAVCIASAAGRFVSTSFDFPVLARLAGLVAATVLLAGCSTVSYYAQAVHGHLDMIGRARPVDAVARDPATPDALRARLEVARRIRDFASRELALPDNGSYRRYADLGRPFVVWNVFAAPEFSVEPVEHCFPVAGCVAYRGYYAEADARAEAAREAARGRDTYVGGVPAYSTLGWFDDPLLNTFIHLPEAELARLVFHELAHQVAYAKGDTLFNESFATVVEEEGVRRWIEREATLGAGVKGAGDGMTAPATLRAYEAGRERRRAVIALLLDYRGRLARLYAAPGSDADKRTGKAALLAALNDDYARLKASWGGFAGFDRLFAGGVNNALLASVASYNALVPALRTLLERQGGDLAAFYREVQRLAGLPGPERRRQLGQANGDSDDGSIDAMKPRH
jgi:predicted aminopeptidase